MGSFIAASEYLVDVTGTTESASPLVNKSPLQPVKYDSLQVAMLKSES